MELTHHQRNIILRNTIFFKDELSEIEKNSQNIAFDDANEIVQNANTYDQLIMGIKALIIEEKETDSPEVLKQIRMSNSVYRAYLYAVGVETYENH
ncbi:hypothetical protein FPV13_08760 [Mammaliicoccus sciuri]|uniref:hypothetical protein n=1 Tax=Mammaliicoccus sciuri TaxID=1296 RepID=UPI00118BF62C|nr:hypothetical protein [Mammaliicoccus sciuri]QDR64967.1 hypothetical protein FPV13_08760 [Mammaliicoccus sciuri]